MLPSHSRFMLDSSDTAGCEGASSSISVSEVFRSYRSCISVLVLSERAAISTTVSSSADAREREPERQQIYSFMNVRASRQCGNPSVASFFNEFPHSLQRSNQELTWMRYFRFSSMKMFLCSRKTYFVLGVSLRKYANCF